MDADALRNQLIVLSAIGATTAFWWFVLVPNARLGLARNKKSGALRAYLEELKTDDARGPDVPPPPRGRRARGGDVRARDGPRGHDGARGTTESARARSNVESIVVDEWRRDSEGRRGRLLYTRSPSAPRA